jgi:hypothetical protein
VRNCLAIAASGQRGAALKGANDAEGENSTMFYTGYNSLFGLLVLAGDIWAIINIFQSSASNERKLLWTLVVVLLPLLGLILWYFLGPRDGRV